MASSRLQRSSPPARHRRPRHRLLPPATTPTLQCRVHRPQATCMIYVVFTRSLAVDQPKFSATSRDVPSDHTSRNQSGNTCAIAETRGHAVPIGVTPPMRTPAAPVVGAPPATATDAGAAAAAPAPLPSPAGGIDASGAYAPRARLIAVLARSTVRARLSTASAFMCRSSAAALYSYASPFSLNHSMKRRHTSTRLASAETLDESEATISSVASSAVTYARVSTSARSAAASSRSRAALAAKSLPAASATACTCATSSPCRRASAASSAATPASSASVRLASAMCAARVAFRSSFEAFEATTAVSASRSCRSPSATVLQHTCRKMWQQQHVVKISAGEGSIAPGRQ